MIILVILIYCATYVPYRVCFDDSQSSIMMIVFDTSIDFIFIFDIIVVFNSPIHDEIHNKFIVSRKKICT